MSTSTVEWSTKLWVSPPTCSLSSSLFLVYPAGWLTGLSSWTTHKTRLSDHDRTTLVTILVSTPPFTAAKRPTITSRVHSHRLQSGTESPKSTPRDDPHCRMNHMTVINNISAGKPWRLGCWNCMARRQSHQPYKICFGTKPSEDGEHGGNTQVCPCTEALQMLPRLRTRILWPSESIKWVTKGIPPKPSSMPP